jgi:hypothetical protein
MSFSVFAQRRELASWRIPSDLRHSASVVVRSEEFELEISGLASAKYSIHRIITVLNAAGMQALFFVARTDKFTELENVAIVTYDSTGMITHHYGIKDLVVSLNGEELVDNIKTYLIRVPSNYYPISMEIRYDLRFKGILEYPTYRILAPGEALENSSYSVRVRKDLDLRYKERNIHLPPVIEEDSKYKIYTWKTKNLAPIPFEENTTGMREQYPYILVAPNKFRLDDYEGDMSSWKNFGIWYSDLQKHLDGLTEERAKFIQELVKPATDEREKVRLIYLYMQKNFRYVAIELGIGGFRPFPASFTDKKKYGDCKGLSAYMQAALAAIGIKSYQVLIQTQADQALDPEFPCSQFNHVILCVPQPKDSIWLECTSRTMDFGVLSSITQNRLALLISDTGGVIVKTPGSAPRQNRQYAYSRIAIREDGSGHSQTEFRSTGEFKQELIQLQNEMPDRQKMYAVNQWGFKEPSDLQFGPDLVKNVFRVELVQNLESVPEFIAGDKMFFATRQYRICNQSMPKNDNRRADYYFTFVFEKTDTTAFLLPKGFTLDALPDSRKFSCPYASYSCHYWYDENSRTIFSAARLMLNQEKIPAQDYDSVKLFFDSVYVENGQRIVIRKN